MEKEKTPLKVIFFKSNAFAFIFIHQKGEISDFKYPVFGITLV